MAIVRGQKSTRQDLSGATHATSWGTAPAAGQKVLVWVWAGTTTDPTSVADNGSPSRTFTLAKKQTGTGVACWIYYADNVQPSGTYTVTVTWAASQFGSCGGLAYDNVATGGPTATNGQNQASATAISSLSVSESNNALYAAGYVNDGGGPSSQTITGDAFVKEHTLEDGTSFTEGGGYDLINATGSHTMTLTMAVARPNESTGIAVWPESAGGGAAGPIASIINPGPTWRRHFRRYREYTPLIATVPVILPLASGEAPWGSFIWGSGVWGGAPALPYVLSASATLTLTSGALQVSASSSALSQLSGGLSLAEATAGTTVSASTLSANLGQGVALNGAEASNSTAAGSLTENQALAASVSSQAVASGSLTETEALNASLTALSIEQVTASVVEALTASSALLSSNSGALSAVEALAVSATAVSIVSGNLQVVSGLQVAGASTALAGLSASLTQAKALTGIGQAVGSLQAAFGEAVALTTTSVASSGLSANLQLLTGQQIAGSSTAQGSLSANLALAEALTTSAASFVSLSGALAVGTSPALAGVSGSISIASASLSLSVQLSGSEAGSSSLTANLQVLSGLQVAGSVTGLAGVNASLKLAAVLAATVNASSSLTASPGGTAALAGNSGSLGALAGNLQAPLFISASIVSVSRDSGQLSLALSFAGSSFSKSTLNAPLGLGYGLQGLIVVASYALLSTYFRDLALILGTPGSRWQIGQPDEGRWKVEDHLERWLVLPVRI